MAANCAVCREPIRKGDKFSIVETEAVHRACVGGQTVGTSLRLRAVGLQRDLEAAARDLANERDRSDSYVQARNRLRKDLETANRALDHLKRDCDAITRERDEARRERDRAVAERDAARREAALHQTIQQTPPADPPSDNRDATEVRFSLLDLD